jgi:hypothetical protein
MVARMHLCPNGLLVWLRGGGASYHIESDMGTAVLVSVHLDGYTDSAKATYTSMAYNAETVRTSILSKEISHPYPVGSIYISIKETSPASIYGGSWTKIKDKFLYATSTAGDAGKPGGSATVSFTPEGTIAGTVAGHSLTIKELAEHSHVQKVTGDSKNHHIAVSSSNSYSTVAYSKDGTRTTGYTVSDGIARYNQDAYGGTRYPIGTETTGTGAAHSHGFSGTFTGKAKDISINPAHYTVHAWVRTA